jgi:CopG family nickel-responsive transcriptional regulator
LLQRIGVSLDDRLLEQFDEHINARGYTNRSEALRDLIREQLVARQWAQAGDDDSEQVAVVTLVYEHDSMDLSKRLTRIQHRDPSAIVSALHIHLDHHNCLEVLILRGKARHILHMGEQLTAIRGVKFGKLIPATTGRDLT